MRECTCGSNWPSWITKDIKLVRYVGNGTYEVYDKNSKTEPDHKKLGKIPFGLSHRACPRCTDAHEITEILSGDLRTTKTYSTKKVLAG